MSKINTPPLGLQDLLGSQNFGDNPSELGNTVFGGIDLIPFLGSSRLSYARATQSTALSIAGGLALLIIPENEAWLVHGITGTANGATSGDELGMSLAMREVFTVGVEHIIETAPPRPAVAGEIMTVTFQPSRPILLEPFTQIAIRLIRIPNVGSVTFETTAQFLKLTV